MNRRVAMLVVTLAALSPMSLNSAAQQSAVGRSAARPPARIDSLTASIRGRITTIDTGAPVRRAEVRVTSESGTNRLATTDGEGSYQLRDMPAGTYRLTVSKRGFVPAQFGQRRPFDAADTITLAEGARVTANVALTRGSAIAGRISDEFGDPAEGVLIQVMRPRTIEGRRRLVAVGLNDRSDDTGAFRVYGLPPGEYYVAARARDGQLGPENRGVPTYFPGTVNLAEAQRVPVTLGAEAIVNFQIAPVRSARISGIVVNAAGVPVSDAMIGLTSEVVGVGQATRSFGVAPLTMSAHSAPDGSFAIPDVPPGQYVLNAMTHADTPLDTQTSSMPVVVDNADLTGLTLTTRPPVSLKGTIVRDSGVVRALPAGVGVRATSLNAGGMSMHNNRGNEFSVLKSGPFWLEVENLPDDWMVKAIMVDGTDMSDGPIDLKSQTATARIVLTDRVTEVRGAIANHDLARGTTVIVFPEDSSKWTYPTRFLRSARVDDLGSFSVRGLPPERYLVIAVDSVEDGENGDPEFLSRMQDRATAVTLGEGERKTVNLSVVHR